MSFDGFLGGRTASVPEKDRKDRSHFARFVPHGGRLFLVRAMLHKELPGVGWTSADRPGRKMLTTCDFKALEEPEGHRRLGEIGFGKIKNLTILCG